MDQDETWHAGRPWPWPHCVRWGPSSPFNINVALGMQVGLRSGDFVLDRDPASPPQKRERSPLPNFRPICIVAKRLDASRCHLVWSRPQPRGLCSRWGPSPPNFRPMFIIVIVISLEHCIIVTGLVKFKFYF